MKIVKIVVSHTSGRIQDKDINRRLELMYSITGQKPCITYAKKNISSWKARSGMTTGCKVTLRRDRAKFFLEKLVNYCFFKQRNFKGFVGANLTYNSLNFGYDDLTNFPETEKLEDTIGINIAIITDSSDIYDNIQFLRKLNIPIYDDVIDAKLNQINKNE